ncbi:MAG: winged helix-turn-helix domain-containing protein, partial [Candidatus Thiodiazotropha sp.]
MSQKSKKKIIESDGRYTIRDIAKAVGISLSRVHFILK